MKEIQEVERALTLPHKSSSSEVDDGKENMDFSVRNARWQPYKEGAPNRGGQGQGRKMAQKRACANHFGATLGRQGPLDLPA